jgi:hypothetical protein
MFRFARLLLFGSLVLALAGPSSAEAGWLARHRQTPRYRGEWLSCSNGHHGRLSACVHQKSCGCYRVRFCGTFAGCIPFVYSAPMTVTGRGPNGEVRLCASSQLPLFGNFTCHARVSGCRFNATYHSEKDHGRFTMTRK